MANNNNIDLGLIVALIKKLGGSAGDINQQIADYINAHKNIAGGIAGLDDASQVAPAQLPDRNHQLILPYIVELTSNEMANAIDAGTEDYGTIAVGQLATPTTNDVFVIGHLYQYVSEEGVYNWNDITEAVEINSTSAATLPLDTIKIGNNVYANTYVIEANFDEGEDQDLTQVLTSAQMQLIKEHPQNIMIISRYLVCVFRYLDSGLNSVRFAGVYVEDYYVMGQSILYIDFETQTYSASFVGTRGNNIFPLTRVTPSSFVGDNTYAEQGFNFKAAVDIGTAVKHDSFATVAFSMADAMSGNYAPYCETYDGGVYIWAKEKPTSTLIIPSIEVMY